MSDAQNNILVSRPDVRAAIGMLASRADAVSGGPSFRGDFSAATYVDPKLLEQLATPDNQILFGRRGTGKTHALRVLEKRLAARPSEIVLYADLRQLGDVRKQPPQERGAVFLQQLLNLIEWKFTLRTERGFAFAQANEHLQAFRAVLDEQGFALVELKAATSFDETSDLSAELAAKLSATSPSVSSNLATRERTKESEHEARTYKPVEQVNFTAVARALQDLTTAAGLTRLTLLIDEWSEVQPVEVQPYLADHIKRVLFAAEGVTVKIAAIQHRSHLGVRGAGGAVVGFEESADIFPVTILDETAFSFDRNPSLIQKMLAELLYRHLTVELARTAATGYRPRTADAPSGGRIKRWLRRHRRGGRAHRDKNPDVVVQVADALRQPDWGDTFIEQAGQAFMHSEYGVSGPDDLVQRIFDRDAFRELCRAAQSVPRDFITLLKTAVFAADAGSRLTGGSVRDALHELYSSKRKDMTEPEQRMMTKLLQVVTGRGARCFLPDDRLTSNEAFQLLVDRRLLHRLRRGVSDPQDPARPYDVYTLDYAAYLPLLLEGKLKDDDFTERIPANFDETVTPFSDGRRIHRIIVRYDDVA